MEEIIMNEPQVFKRTETQNDYDYVTIDDTILYLHMA